MLDQPLLHHLFGKLLEIFGDLQIEEIIAGQISSPSWSTLLAACLFLSKA